MAFDRIFNVLFSDEEDSEEDEPVRKIRKLQDFMSPFDGFSDPEIYQR
jgi:hypothetical protein